MFLINICASSKWQCILSFFFFFHFVFDKRYKSISNLNWGFIKVFLSFQTSEDTNLQKIKMSGSNFVEIKSGVIFLKKSEKSGFLV